MKIPHKWISITDVTKFIEWTKNGFCLEGLPMYMSNATYASAALWSVDEEIAMIYHVLFLVTNVNILIDTVVSKPTHDDANVH